VFIFHKFIFKVNVPVEMVHFLVKVMV